jgi:hypothetical protein
MTKHANPVPSGVSLDATVHLVILDTPNPDPSKSDEFELRNMGSLPKIGTIFIDCNPGEMTKPINFLFVQTQEAKRPALKASSDRCYVYCESIPIPTPRSFREILDKMNEGQFLKLGPTDKGICTVPRSRRAVILEYLGFKSS